MKRGRKKGSVPWNKGIKMGLNPKHSEKMKGRKLTEKHKKKTSKTMKKIILPQRFKKGHIPWNKGKSHLIGREHWNWKGGISGKSEKERQTLQYEIWRNEVYKRDNWNCRLCGNKKQIVAHHLKLFSKFPELRFSINNGITLCRKCHQNIHKPRRKNYEEIIG